jgi:tellurite methyltransferase
VKTCAKWDVRYANLNVDSARPARVLSENVHLLPSAGRAADVASGLGGNALLLARLGLAVVAYDISTSAVDKLNAYARERGLSLNAQRHDVEKEPLERGGFDVVVVSYFLDRRSVASLLAALRPCGLLFYQTFIRDCVESVGPRNPDFRLEPNELLDLFAPLKIILYKEEGTIGDTSRGFRNEAMLIGQKLG